MPSATQFSKYSAQRVNGKNTKHDINGMATYASILDNVHGYVVLWMQTSDITDMGQSRRTIGELLTEDSSASTIRFVLAFPSLNMGQSDRGTNERSKVIEW